MIPKEAIERAIEGGWKSHWEYDWEQDTEWTVEKKWIDVAGERSYPLSEIALDPSFWQSLTSESQMAAHAFLDVIFAGGDTEKFWQDLLKN